MTGPDGVVHQLFFGWSTVHRQHTVMCHSFQGDEDMRRWAARLKNHVRLASTGGSDAPASAFSYLVFPDGQAAVIRRVARGRSPGRENAHALVGPVAVLTPPVALGLCLSTEAGQPWQDEVAEGVSTYSFDPQYFARRADPAPVLREAASGLGGRLVNVVAQVLEQPDRPVSVIGCPERERLAMVWALRRALDGDRPARDRSADWRWSFSTYADRADDSVANLPWILFLPPRPTLGVSHRLVVDLARPVLGSRTPHARDLVAGVFAEPSRTPAQQDPAQQEVAQHDLAPQGATQQDATQLDAVQQDVARQDVGHPEEAQAAHSPLPDYGGAWATRDDRPASAETAAETWSSAPSYRKGPPNPKADLAKPVLAATNTADLRAELKLLAHDHPAVRIRENFDSRVVDKIVDFAELSAPRELVERLLETLYGPRCRDLLDPTARQHALKLIDGCRSDQVATALAAYAGEQNATDIGEAAYRRWLRVGRLRGPVSPGSRRVPRVAGGRGALLVGVGLAAVLLLVGFLLGLLVASPAEQAGPTTAVPPVPQSSVTEAWPTTPPRTEPTPGQQLSGTVTAEVAADRRLFGFVRSGDRYYPQQECRQDNAFRQEWRCEKRSGTVDGEFVAAVVPEEEARGLQDIADTGQSVAKREGWDMRSVRIT
ncbi:hypothetical protein [Saccharothrix coeruleofusca]|uniref:Uncharacterized protein n=1 Tax=Saccharothrix coeruleofusca TaxID=33919 RepID=A0A918AQ32_9PSEU|nr:hypothetical protein [Saccharothrix coeruleofusca]GGP68682.1 hypothetical protein GCM10010185_46980 [Saccharothrix coeruleofusca]